MDPEGLIAAIDLGSNSFRLEICRVDAGHLVRVAYLKESVRLGAGLDDRSQLDGSTAERGLACLARFAERLRPLAPRRVRAVATATLREARNRQGFISRAQKLLGVPIDVISGHEEARLIYAGVCHFLPEADEQRLVFDIGGRSTEVIAGQGAKPYRVESYAVGSVDLSMRYFADGRLTPRTYEAACVAAQAELETVPDLLADQRWDAVYGSSGTVGAVSDILRAEGLTDGQITPAALAELRRRMFDAGHVDKLRLAGLKDERRAVLGGGLAIVDALIRLLDLRRLAPARGALRHGVLVELMQRDGPVVNVRASTVRHLQKRFGVDLAQAQRVATCAGQLFAALRTDDNEVVKRAGSMLQHAAELHEVGMAISHEHHHRHGEYIISHADAAGFAEHQLERLALLVLAHRGGLRKVEARLADESIRAKVLALRLAVLLCHARRDPQAEGCRLQPAGDGAKLTVPAAWAETHPQSMHLLREEARAWSRSPWPLELVVD